MSSCSGSVAGTRRLEKNYLYGSTKAALHLYFDGCERGC
jgi:hypothetical protein